MPCVSVTACAPLGGPKKDPIPATPTVAAGSWGLASQAERPQGSEGDLDSRDHQEVLGCSSVDRHQH